MEYSEVSLIQSKLEVARASRRARKLARQDLPELWVPVVLDALGQLARLGIAVDRATAEYGCLHIIMPTRDPHARAIEAQAARTCATLSGMDDLRFRVLVSGRQRGPTETGRALAQDRTTVEAVREAHQLEPSNMLAAILAAADAASAPSTDCPE
jgi:hypothetical protein